MKSGRSIGIATRPIPCCPRELAAEQAEDRDLPLERRRLGIVLDGGRGRIRRGGKSDTTPMDFYDLKGVLQELFKGLHLADGTYVPSVHPLYHPGRAAALMFGEQEIGRCSASCIRSCGEKFDLPEQAVLIGEFDPDALLAPVASLFTRRDRSRAIRSWCRIWRSSSTKRCRRSGSPS